MLGMPRLLIAQMLANVPDILRGARLPLCTMWVFFDAPANEHSLRRK